MLITRVCVTSAYALLLGGSLAFGTADAAWFFTAIDALPGRYGYVSGMWRVEQHLRLLGDVNGDQRADIVAFGNEGVSVALGLSNGRFSEPRDVFTGRFGYLAGGWRVDRHPRMLADVNGDHRLDIVAFGNGGVIVALANADGTFREPVDALVGYYGYEAGGWRTENHIRLLSDVDGDDKADIVAFGNRGVSVALGRANGTFQQPVDALPGYYGYEAGGWRVDAHPRMVFSRVIGGPQLFGVRGSIVAFGNDGVSVAHSWGRGLFDQPFGVVALRNKFNYNSGWRVNMHPRLLADVNGDGRSDIVGFGNAAVGVSLRGSDGSFGTPFDALVGAYGYESASGSWRVEKHPRMLADVNKDNRADIVGFGENATWLSLATVDGRFPRPQNVFSNFSYAAGWRVDRHPRYLADVNGDGCADIVGFWDTGVKVALSQCTVGTY